MKKHEILSPQSRAALFDPPAEPAAIVRYYTLSGEDLALIRRRDANRLGFALHLAYLRFPEQVLGASEMPPSVMLAFIAEQLAIGPEAVADYACREETRWEHITLNGDYIWPAEPIKDGFRPLRDTRSSFLEAALRRISGILCDDPFYAPAGCLRDKGRTAGRPHHGAGSAENGAAGTID